MFRYRVKLWPEKARSTTVNLEPTIEVVLAIAEEYNDEGRRASNRKWIEDGSIEIHGDSIELILCSETWLNFPTKALRGFISKLSRTGEYEPLITESGRLFKGDSEHIENNTTNEELTDEEAIIEIVKLFHRENDENRRKIDAIKSILGGTNDVQI